MSECKRVNLKHFSNVEETTKRLIVIPVKNSPTTNFGYAYDTILNILSDTDIKQNFYLNISHTPTSLTNDMELLQTKLNRLSLGGKKNLQEQLRAANLHLGTIIEEMKAFRDKCVEDKITQIVISNAEEKYLAVMNQSITNE